MRLALLTGLLLLAFVAATSAAAEDADAFESDALEARHDGLAEVDADELQEGAEPEAKYGWPDWRQRSRGSRRRDSYIRDYSRYVNRRGRRLRRLVKSWLSSARPRRSRRSDRRGGPRFARRGGRRGGRRGAGRLIRRLRSLARLVTGLNSTTVGCSGVTDRQRRSLRRWAGRLSRFLSTNSTSGWVAPAPATAAPVVIVPRSLAEDDAEAEYN